MFKYLRAMTIIAVMFFMFTNITQAVVVHNVTELVNAVAAANGGGDNQILLANGIYTLSDMLYITGNGITIRSQSGNRSQVTIQGAGMYGGVSHIFNVEGSNFTARDMTIGGVANHAIQIHGEANADNPLLSNLRIVDTYEQMVKVSYISSSTNSSNNGILENCLLEYSSGVGPQWYIGGIDAHYATGWIVRNNVFRNIMSPADDVAEHAIHFWSDSRDTLVEANLIINCDRGIGFGLGVDRGHINGIIRNNMIVHTAVGSAFPDVGISLETAENADVYNNTVYLSHTYPNAIEYRFSGTSGGIIANNLCNKSITSRDGGTATVYSNNTSAISGWFVNVSTGDLHLSSPVPTVVDSGSVIPGLTTDFDGDSRPQGAGIDIGADEYLGATKNDFNGDGQADILWRNYSSGANAVWYLQSIGSTAGFRQCNLQSMAMEPGQKQAKTFQNPWEAGEILYKDERVYHDVLEVDAPQEKIEANVYRDALEAGPVFYRPGAKGIAGDIQELLMPGDHEDGVQALSILSTAYLNTISNTSWHIEATGDLNGDGRVDILWRNYASGQNAVWYMNGSVISGTAYLTTITDTLWRIEGAADFNGDGNTDLLWRHYGTGQNALWYMSGAIIIGTTYLGAITDTNWRIEATGDFNGDDYTDFVWRNYGTGQNALWYMSGSTHSGTVFLTAVADVYWAIAGAGDFNRDGNTDLLWRHYTAGANSVWYMNGTTISGTATLTAVGDLNWKIENH